MSKEQLEELKKELREELKKEFKEELENQRKFNVWQQYTNEVINPILDGKLQDKAKEKHILKGATYTYLGLITGMFMIGSIAFIYDDLFNEGD